MPRIHYLGFEVSASPEQLVEGGKWSLRVLITKHHDSRNETLEQFFEGKQTFGARDEAEQHSIEFGKRIIDGKQPGYSLEGLL